MPVRRKKFLTPARVALACVLLAIIFGLAVWLVIRDADIAVLNPQGLIAKQQRDLIVFTTLLSVVVVLPVFTLLGLFAWKYREGNKKATYTPDEDGNKWLEVLWWGIPIIIIGILGIITWVTTHQLDPYKPIASTVPAIKVQVVALQWKWLFLYPDQGVASLNEMRIPAGTPVNLEITADAPMSAFWIPSLAGQTYAMNGMTAKLSLVADKPGTYRGSNTNINGEGYADMHFNAVAMDSRKAFDDWARSVRIGEENGLDFDKYQKLAEPSKANPIMSYQLRDKALYTEIMNKYMSAHAENSEGGHSKVGH
jgi:cytochrome o ubiquinol oxidase subunit 2